MLDNPQFQINKRLIYLASPYLYRGSDKTIDPLKIQQERYEKALEVTARLMNKGLCVFSPIVHTHNIAVKYDLPKGSEYWLQFDEVILGKCAEIIVLMIDGWKESSGVQKEIEIAKKLGMEITYLND